MEGSVPQKYLRIVHPWVFFSILGLYFVSLYSYLLFHSLVELFSVAVAFSILLISWNARRFVEENYLLLLGIAFFFTGAIDLLHTLAYKGMGIFQGYDADLPTQLWIAARYLESLSLLAVPLLVKRRVDLRAVWAVYTAVGSVLLFSIFIGAFPSCFIEGSGLTPFKKISEYIISAILFASLILVHMNRGEFEPRTLLFLIFSIAATIVSELAFTFYVSVYGLSNLAGHFFKLLSFYFIYKAITENCLVRPYETLFRNLKQSETTLRDQREWLRVTLSSIGDAVIAADTEGRISFINPIAQALTGWTVKDAMERPIRSVFRIIDEKTRQPAEDIVGRVLAEGNIFNLANNTALLTRDGREIPIEDSAAPIKNGAGHLLGVVLVFRDVTEKRRAQTALSESAEKLRIVADFTYDWEYWRSPENRFLYVSPSCERITGYAREEFIRDPDLYSRIIHPEDREQVLAHLHGAEPPHEACELEYRIVHRNGRERWIGHACRPVLNARGEPIGRRATDRDITDRKQAEDELRKSRDELEIRVQERTAELKQRAEQLSLLASELTLAEERQRRRLAEILHDHLQQLLVGARLNLETLAGHIAGNHQKTYRKVCDLLMESIQTSRSLTAELSPSILYQQGLAAALEWLARWMQEKYGLAVQLQTDPEIVLNQESVSVLLFQSVRELLFNVVKHARVYSAEVGMYKENRDRLRIVISDRGAGFDPGLIWKGNQRSGGFGLFSIRERLEFLGGSLEVESAPGKGAFFTLIAPLGKTDPQPLPQDTGNGERIRLMLADDHIVMRQGLSTMLSAHSDIEIVAEAPDGEAAVQLARKLKPDVILMDVGMPKVNGIEATRIIHSEMPEIRIIGLSMFEDPDIAASIIEAGAAAYLTKSGNPDGLLKTILGDGLKVPASGGSNPSGGL